MSRRSDEGLILRCLKRLDEHTSVKLLFEVWGPRLEFFVRLLLVATFLDDSFRAATHFSDHVEQVGKEGYLKSMAETQPELVNVLGTVALTVGLLAQSLGSLCLLALYMPDEAAKVLMGWALAQPVLYAQLANVQFMAESLSLVGGLYILRAHLYEQAKRNDYRRVPSGGGELLAPDDKEYVSEGDIARTQLLGRLLLMAAYLYHAGSLLRTAFGSSISIFVVDAAVVVGLMGGCALVAVGLKSRTIALALALLNLGYICYQHPFFRFVWREGGEWKYDEAKIRQSMPHVALPKELSEGDFESWLVFDLHRYYFFHGLSISGALLLLAQFGPGKIAVEEEEIILGDVQRVRD